MDNAGMIYGYPRVTTDAQDLTSRLAQLKACEKVFREKITGTTADRPQLQKLMKVLAPGDVVIIPAVDRLSRETTDLLVIARDMQRAGAGIRSLAEPFLDTTSDFAEIIFAILGVAAKLERRRILERTARGRADAKEKGVKIRPQAYPHAAPAKRGPRARRSWRDAAQRRPLLQRQSGDDFAAHNVRGKGSDRGHGSRNSARRSIIFRCPGIYLPWGGVDAFLSTH
jgi:DNA invertase Pin-like site-specific DNA recombinase